jgi:NAD(P)-dependent dehydrogenase (short-subunit alcohol dehydrogenase family)
VSDVHEYDGDAIAEVLWTNVVGYVRVIHAFLPLLERSPDPRVVNVSSGLGSFALAHHESRIESRAPSPLYAAAKSAVNNADGPLRAAVARDPHQRR